jgi:hypothetical protein
MARFNILAGGLACVLIVMQAEGTVGQAKPQELRIPVLQATSFTDQTVKLPEALRGKVGVLVVGFTRGSQDAITGWGRRLGADYHDSASVAYFEMPVLAAVPRMLRGMVMGRIKGEVPDRARAHFVPIVENEAGWRAVANYKSGDDACILLVDEQGVVRWQTHARASDDAYADLKRRIQALGG